MGCVAFSDQILHPPCSCKLSFTKIPEMVINYIEWLSATDGWWCFFQYNRTETIHQQIKGDDWKTMTQICNNPLLFITVGLNPIFQYFRLIFKASCVSIFVCIFGVFVKMFSVKVGTWSTRRKRIQYLFCTKQHFPHKRYLSWTSVQKISVLRQSYPPCENNRQMNLQKDNFPKLLT